MHLRHVIFILLAVVILFPIAVNGQTEDEVPISVQEKVEAQQAARLFVSRMQQTRDVTPLINELFLPDFISHFVSGDCECISPSLYSQFSASERSRWFVALYNYSYLVTLDVLNRPKRNYSEDELRNLGFTSILPHDLAVRLQNLITQETQYQITDHQSFESLLNSMEGLLAEARQYLAQQNIEQTPEFQRELDDRITDTDIGYRVRAYIGGNNIKDCEPLIGFPANQKFYRVEVPLMMGVILVRDGGQMRIVRLTYVDGD
jgi:hypothetical protein